MNKDKLQTEVIQFVKSSIQIFFICFLYILMAILIVFALIQIPYLIINKEILTLKLPSSTNIYSFIKDIGAFIVAFISSLIAIVALGTYIRSAKNQEFTNILTKRSTIHTLQKDLRDSLFNAFTRDKKEQDDIEYHIKYQITPTLKALLNTYNSMIGIYFESDNSYKELFNKIFLNEIKEFLNYKSYEELLKESYEIIDLSQYYIHIKEYVILHNITIGKIYEIHKRMGSITP